MKINISIDGVLRNFLQKYEFHYGDYFFNTEVVNNDETFEYGLNRPIHTINDFRFQSKDEQNNFMYIEFPLEIYGYAGLTTTTSISDLNKLIYESKNDEISLIGLNEFGKAKPSTLFFLSKNGFLGNNIKFITTEDIKKEWKKCNIWVTDNEDILSKCPKNKHGIKFNTINNNHFTYKNEINQINEIKEICLKFSEKSIT